MTKRPIYLVSVTPSDDPDVIHLPILQTRWLHPDIDLSGIEGIIFTSKNAVDAMERLSPQWKDIPVVCVGKATQRRAEALGAQVLAVSDGYGDGLYDLILSGHAEKKWLYPRPKVVASDFSARLVEAGVSLVEPVVYETICRADAVKKRIKDDAVVIFTSPSALRCFRSAFSLTPAHSVVAIGKTTQSSLPGHRVHVAAEPTVASCIALAKQLTKENE